MTDNTVKQNREMEWTDDKKTHVLFTIKEILPVEKLTEIKVGTLDPQLQDIKNRLKTQEFLLAFAQEVKRGGFSKITMEIMKFISIINPGLKIPDLGTVQPTVKHLKQDVAKIEEEMKRFNKFIPQSAAEPVPTELVPTEPVVTESVHVGEMEEPKKKE